MSKKASEFERYDRMKKMEREAEVEKRKAAGGKKKSGRPKMEHEDPGAKVKTKFYDMEIEEEFLID